MVWQRGPYRGTEAYGQMQIWIPLEGSKWETVRVHRLMFFVHSKRLDIKTEPQEVSHMCHNMRCVNIDHLVLELSVDNYNRDYCRKKKKCTDTHTPEMYIL